MLYYNEEHIEHIEDVVRYLSYMTDRVTLEAKYLEDEKPVCVLRFVNADLPEDIEKVEVSELGLVDLVEREEFCFCDEVCPIVLYEQGHISPHEGVARLEKYVNRVVLGDYTWDEYEKECLKKRI